MRFLQFMSASLVALFVSARPLSPDDDSTTAINTPVDIHSTFQHCDAKQKASLTTTMEDIHRLAVLGEHAAQLIVTGEAESLEIFEKRTNLTQGTAKTLLQRWLGSGDVAAMAKAVSGESSSCVEYKGLTGTDVVF